MKPSISALFAVLFLTSGSAFAGDGKAYVAATSCVTSGGTLSINAGRLYNTSTTAAMTVNCGLLVDAGTAYDFSLTEVWIHDQNSSGSIACTQYSSFQSGATYSTRSSTLSYPAAAGAPSAYTNSTPTLLNNTSGSVGYTFDHGFPVWNYLLCSIPKSASSTSNLSGIHTVFAQEN
jgi:hypothetical protein